MYPVRRRLRRLRARTRAWLSTSRGSHRSLPTAGRPDIAATLARLLAHVGQRRLDHVVVVADGVPAALRDALLARFPDASLTVIARRAPATGPHDRSLHLATRTAERVRILMEAPPPDAILDLSRRPNDKQGALRHLLYFLRDDGVYLSADAFAGPAAENETMRAVLVELAHATPDAASTFPDGRDDAAEAHERAAAVRAFERIGDDALVVKRGDHVRKLRDWESDAILDARLGPTWGSTVVHEPAFTFRTRNAVSVYGESLITLGRHELEVPEMRVRVYEGAEVAARQLVAIDDFAAPDTFRHPHQGRLHNGKVITWASPHLGRLRGHVPDRPTREVAGALFHLDTEYPNHFGHVTTEVLSRCWGWAHVRALEPDVRPVVSLAGTQRAVAQFEVDLLAALGIDLSDAEVVRPGERLRVERLYAATPQFENPKYAHPRLTETWRRLAQGLGPVSSPVRNERVFVSRRDNKRVCLNRPEVERFFADAGFAIVYPEDYSYAEQGALFAQARLLAGFGGSAMFNMMFAPRARVVVISGDAYGANNEELIAATNGNELHYFWGTSVQRPQRRYDHSLLNVDFTFDLDRFRTDLRAAIS